MRHAKNVLAQEQRRKRPDQLRSLLFVNKSLIAFTKCLLHGADHAEKEGVVLLRVHGQH